MPKMTPTQIVQYIRQHNQVFWRDEGEENDEKLGFVKSEALSAVDDQTIFQIDWQEDEPNRPHTLAEIIAHWPDSVSLMEDGRVYWLTEMNEKRARWAQVAMEAFGAECFHGSEEDDETVMSDLVGDLMHYCIQEGLDWEVVVGRAMGHFEDECSIPE